jgi:malonyl-CoA/methylmalonyl-CoA synthetase
MTSSSPGDRTERPGHFLDELRATFADRAGRPAIRYQDRSWTYGDLDVKARRCAARLRQLGVARGDRVAIATSEKLPFLAAHLGTLHAAAVSLPLNPWLAGDELRYCLRDSGARVVVAGRDVHPIVNALRADLPGLRSLLLDAEAWEAPEAEFSEPAIDRNAACLILYTSASTGRPRGVVHSHAGLASSLRALQAAWRFTPDDVLVNALALFHIQGLSIATHLSLLTGCCMHIEESFHPRRTLPIVGRGSVFMGIPTFYYTFLEQPEFREVARRWSNVRLFTCGSAAIRPEVLPVLESILGRPVISQYGMTEAHVITSLPLDGPWPEGSVGMPLDGIEVRVLRDDGTPARPGEVGSVQLRGPNLFRNYWRNPDATRAAFASGWFDTGDLGSRDAGGFLTLAGRGG